MDHSIVRFSDRAKPNYAHPTVSPFMYVESVNAPNTATTKTELRGLASVRVQEKPTETAVNVPLTTSG
jgi:hypothetical protein